jgi:hypothetical protein
MRAKCINEMFSEESDPIRDMGIEEAEYDRLQQTYKRLEEYMKFEMEDMEFSKTIETLDYLRRVNAYNVSSYFNRKYNFGIRIDPKNVMGGDFAKGQIGNNDIVFSTSGPGKMVYVSIRKRGERYGLPMGTFTRNAGAPWARQDTRTADGSSRTLHGLHAKFLYFCKMLKIDPTPYQVK